MRKSNLVSFAALIPVTVPFVCTATDLLDAPGPGYIQQFERLSRPQYPVALTFSPTIQIYPANGAFSMESLSKMEQAFSQANRIIQSARQTDELKVSETKKQQPMRSAPDKLE
ncbi:hypothetical protein ACXR0O_28235 [Verrucomicrobiota bacterium sgz303538]